MNQRPAFQGLTLFQSATAWKEVRNKKFWNPCYRPVLASHVYHTTLIINKFSSRHKLILTVNVKNWIFMPLAEQMCKMCGAKFIKYSV